VVESLEYNESELARIEAGDLLQHEEGNKTWHSFCLKKGSSMGHDGYQAKKTARFGMMHQNFKTSNDPLSREK